MKRLQAKLVPFPLAFSLCLLWPFGVALSGPVQSNAPATSNSDTDSNQSTYDQRQTGKYNIHVSIKDVAIIEVGQNGIEDVSYADQDYYYDEAQLTIKPLLLNPSTTLKYSTTNQNSTTTKPTIVYVTATNNQTYSPNLLADIAALHSTLNNQNVSSLINISSITQSSLDTSKNHSQNGVIWATPKPVASSTIQMEEINSRSKNFPKMTSIRGALIQKDHPPSALMLPPSEEKTQENNSRIYKFKARRAHKHSPGIMRSGNTIAAYPLPYFHTTKRCRAHQYLDAGGDCRSRRSSSLLKKLLSTLVTLPFPNEPSSEDQEDE